MKCVMSYDGKAGMNLINELLKAINTFKGFQTVFGNGELWRGKVPAGEQAVFDLIRNLFHTKYDTGLKMAIKKGCATTELVKCPPMKEELDNVRQEMGAFQCQEGLAYTSEEIK
eukprot:6467012-Amphidinium_carterae.1